MVVGLVTGRRKSFSSTHLPDILKILGSDKTVIYLISEGISYIIARTPSFQYLPPKEYIYLTTKGSVEWWSESRVRETDGVRG